MVNGPENVWVERAGAGLEPFPAPRLSAGVLQRAAIQIARPLGLDPEAKPTLDARLDDGSRVAICVPPASPSVAITIRRFGKRGFSPEDLVAAGSLPQTVLDAARTTLAERGNILVAGGTGSGKTTMLDALISLLPPAERIVSIEDTLELKIHQPNTVRFEAREIGKSSTTVRDLVKHSLRHRPRPHRGRRDPRRRGRRTSYRPSTPATAAASPPSHANNATSALDRLASCAMQARDLPWDAICRNIVNGISLVPPHEPDRGPARRRGSPLPDRLAQRRQHLAHQPRARLRCHGLPARIGSSAPGELGRSLVPARAKATLAFASWCGI